MVTVEECVDALGSPALRPDGVEAALALAKALDIFAKVRAGESRLLDSKANAFAIDKLFGEVNVLAMLGDTA